MAFEPRQTYRLVPRGGPGLTCDSEGVALGGIPVAWSDTEEEGQSSWKVRSPDEIGEILGRAYGFQRREIVEQCHRGLRRVAARLHAGDLALAGVEALMLRLPRIDPEGMAKLAGLRDLRKDDDAWQNEPRIPAGQPDGGQWTTGGMSDAPSATSERPSTADGNRSDRRPPVAGVRPSVNESNTGTDEVVPAGEMSPEVVVQPPHRLSMKPNANGFLLDGAGGGVFYIPSATEGEPVRPTEVHSLDADAFQVGWHDSMITLTDAMGNVVETGTSPAELDRFNATTGQALGVSIYAFPSKALAAPEGPPTPEEQRQFDQESAAFAEGKRESEQSWSGRVTTGMVLVATALPFLALAPLAADAPVVGPLNTVEEVWPTTDEVGVGSGRATVQAGPYEASVRAPYPVTELQARTFSAVVNGESTTGVADAAADENTAVDAKYVKNWSKSIRNPDSPIGGKSWAIDEQSRMVAQAEKYEQAYDNGVIYHTNSRELAIHYYRVFRDAGLTKFRFVITPAGR